MRKDKINNGHYLELTDRVHVISCIFEDHIYNHPLAEEDKEIRKVTDKIIGLLGKLYQISGTKMYKNDEPISKVVFRRHKNSKD